MFFQVSFYACDYRFNTAYNNVVRNPQFPAQKTKKIYQEMQNQEPIEAEKNK